MTESLVHADAKHDLYWSLRTDDLQVDMEKKIGRARPDLLTETLAIEIQHTPLAIHTILIRMRRHTDQGYHTLWLIPETTIVCGGRVKKSKWIRFIQKLQGGILFIPHTDGKRIVPARIDLDHFGEMFLDKREPIDLDDLQLEVGDFGLNSVTYDAWWVDGCLD